MELFEALLLTDRDDDGESLRPGPHPHQELRDHREAGASAAQREPEVSVLGKCLSCIYTYLQV